MSNNHNPQPQLDTESKHDGEIVIFIQGHTISPCSICLKERNQSKSWFEQRKQWADILLKFPARSEASIIELRLLECCWHPDPNLEFPKLQAHSNMVGTEGIESLPLDEMSVTSSQDDVIIII